MTSDSPSETPEEIFPDAEDESTQVAPTLWRRGVVAGACAGAVVGLIDGLASLRAGNEVVRADDLITVVEFYALVFALCGLVAALVARLFEFRQRALSLLVGLGAAYFFAAAWANVEWLPDFTSPLSITADIVLLALAVWWFRRSYWSGTDEIRMGRWAISGVSAALVALVIPYATGASDDAGVTAAARKGKPQPNVLIFMVDTLRADHLGCYGYERPTSPEIDAFAADAVLFEECRAPTSWTKPSVASLFTSLYPTTHACIQQREVLVPEAQTLAEVFSVAGYRTGAFSDNPFVSPEFGFGQGFEHFDYARPSVVANGTLLGKVLFMTKLLSLAGTPLGVGDKLYRGAETLIDGDDGLTAFLDTQDERPWFAYVHAMEPHLPYDPPREFATAFGYPADADYEPPPPYNGALPFQKAPEPAVGVRERLHAQYDAEIRGVSVVFGEVLDDLRKRGAYENTIVVFVSDHGEEFHEHGGWTHGHSLHRELLRVPLIVRIPDSVGPAAKAGRARRVKGLSTLLDVFPTLTDACAIEFPGFQDAGGMGWSLLPYTLGVDGGKPQSVVASGRAVLGEITSGPVELRSVREGRWLYIRSRIPGHEEEAIYDAVSDPGETRDRRSKQDLTVRTLRGKLAKYVKVLEARALVGASREIDSETNELMKGLGYTGHK